ncbi:hypothetical protein TNCV_768591 [Trichonephila clavipes]|nr:hypothetical protein TNCV_768591 [Trichonephila clavipes]
MMDPFFFVNNVEATPRIPSLITRCDKGTKRISPYLHVKRLDLGKRHMEQQQAKKRLSIKQEPSENPVQQIVSINIVLLVPGNHCLMKLGNNGFIIQPTNITSPHDVPWYEPFSYFVPSDLHNDYLEREAVKGKGTFIHAIWNVHAIPKLYSLVYKALRRPSPQDLTSWTELAQVVLDGCYGQKWPDTVFQVPDSCSICLSPMHWPEKTHCGHIFHMRCLLQHLDVSSTCPLCRAPNPLRSP